jgi:BirA family biotin operon repressor/biotin-[acetyl-CoA-carboxylase] ligase
VHPTVTWHDALPSTMDAAHDLAAQGASHGTAVAAGRQTAGRGSRGRRWDSGTGGLWVSVVAHPRPSDALDTLSIRVGLALATLLEGLMPGLGVIGVKWPNDLHLRGRKLGGILCEARWTGGQCQWVVVGVGVNVRNELDPGHHAIALSEAVAPPPLADLVEPVATAVALASRDGGPLGAADLAAFARRDVLRGRLAREPVPGVVDGITPRGALRVVSTDAAVTEVLGGLVVATD